MKKNNMNANEINTTTDFKEEMNMKKNFIANVNDWRADSNYYRRIAKRELAGESTGAEIVDNSERIMLLKFMAGLSDEAYKAVGIYKRLSKELLEALNEYDGCEAVSVSDDMLLENDIIDCKDWREDVNFWRRTAKRVLMAELVTGDEINVRLYRNLLRVFAGLTDEQYEILDESLLLPVYKTWKNDTNPVRRIAKMILAGEKNENGVAYTVEHKLDDNTLARLRKYAFMTDKELIELSETEGIFMF